MSELMSTPTRNIVTGNQPISGDRAKIFDYKDSVPSSSDIKPAPSIQSPTEGDDSARG